MKPAAFTACFCDWRLIKGRKVVQVVFEVPTEGADAAYQVLGGMPHPGTSVWCAIARLDMDKSVTIHKMPAPDKQLAARAGRLCADPVFQRFMVETHRAETMTEEGAAQGVRLYCNVASRAEIKPGTIAAAQWKRLYDRYYLWRDAPDAGAA